MYDENNTPLTPDPAAPAPELEPDEVVSWYVRPDEGQEITGCYVQPGPMPAAAAPKAVRQEKRRSRKGLWTFLVILAVLVGVVLGVAIVSALRGGNSDGYGGDFDDGDHDASSIVDIFQSDVPTIPRADTDPDLRFYCEKAGEEKLTIQQVYQRVNPATVLVLTDLGEKASVGTGVILTADGYIVTNAHVIAGGQNALVALYNGDRYEAELVGFSSTEDLALLKAVNASGLPTAPLGDSEECQVGDTVYAIGNPLGVELRGTLTQGIISAIDRPVTMEGRVMTLLQTTAALNNGNSGGPLINCYGQVIGINTMKMSNFYSSSTTVEGIGFAIPIDTAKPIIDELIEKGYVSGRPAIGIDGETLPATYRIYYRLPQGIYVTRVYRNSDAAAKGISEGDIITAINGVSVTTMEQLNRVKNQFTAGQTITLTIYHGGVSSDVEIILMDRANA